MEEGCIITYIYAMLSHHVYAFQLPIFSWHELMLPCFCSSDSEFQTE